MPRKSRKRKAELSEQDRLNVRLELIRKRHHELILKPREMFDADMDDDFGDPLDALVASEEMQLAEAIGAEQL